MRRLVVGILLVLRVGIVSAQTTATLQLEVRSDAGPIRAADVVVNGKTYQTNAQGVVIVTVPPGRVDLVVVKAGFAPASTSIDVPPAQQQPVVIQLTREVTVEEHVTVSATRTDRGIEDQPMRVEVIDREEIDEKSMMTPGDVAVARRRQHPDSGHARAVHALPVGWPAIVWRAGLPRPDADPAARSGP